MTAADETTQLRPEGWIAEHGDAMYRYALLRLGNAEAAEEALGEALASAYASRESYRGDSTERTWLIGILRFKVLDLLRAKRSGRSEELDEEEAEGCGPHDRWAAVGDSPAERAEFRQVLWDCVSNLPDMQRSALMLRVLDGLSSESACQILGVTPTHLWTLIHRAKRRLRAQLTERWFAARKKDSV
jgi:RNA polymerase sigma factor (sigma-70 family)